MLAPRSLGHGRLLLAVARRFGNAPTRNLFKRRIRAIFYEEQLFNQNFDWVFVVKSKPALKHDFQVLKKLIYDILQKATSQDK